MADYSLKSQYPSITYETADTAQILLGMEFYVASQAWLKELWLNAEAITTYAVRVWELDTILSNSQIRFSGEIVSTAQGWHSLVLPTPLELVVSQPYLFVYDKPFGKGYGYYSGLHNIPRGEGPLVAEAGGATLGGNGNNRYYYDGNIDSVANLPVSGFNNTNYGLDVTVTDVAPVAGVTASVWDGTQERPATVTVWDGAQERPATLEVVVP